jgi:hypothetical protein
MLLYSPFYRYHKSTSVSEVREKVMTLLFEQQCRDSKLSAVTPAAEQVKITGINWFILG